MIFEISEVYFPVYQSWNSHLLKGPVYDLGDIIVHI